MNLELKVILREIQLECQRQIGIERRSGRAIKEEGIEPYPDRYDFDSDVQVVQSETQPQEEKTSNAVLPEKTLAQLVEDTEATDKTESKSKSPDPQMTVDEAISNAEKSAEQPPSQSAQQECDVAPRGPRSKFGAWFEAIRDWHYDRKEKEYKYACAKQRAEDRTYGFEYISNYIAHRIDELEKGN